MTEPIAEDTEDFKYEYYRKYDRLIRISLTQDGILKRAHFFDPAKNEMVSRYSYMTAVLNDPHVDEITEEEFEQRKAELLEAQKKTAEPIGPAPN